MIVARQLLQDDERLVRWETACRVKKINPPAKDEKVDDREVWHA